jgi:hypothetical protein
MLALRVTGTESEGLAATHVSIEVDGALPERSMTTFRCFADALEAAVGFTVEAEEASMMLPVGGGADRAVWLAGTGDGVL